MVSSDHYNPSAGLCRSVAGLAHRHRSAAAQPQGGHSKGYCADGQSGQFVSVLRHDSEREFNKWFRRHVIAAGLPRPMHSARLAQTLRVAVLRSGMHGPRDGRRHGASDAARSPTLRCMTVSAGRAEIAKLAAARNRKVDQTEAAGGAPSLIRQRSALAHFADSDRTSRRVRGAPNNDHGGEEAALVTSPVGTCSFP
jgi:hypothetical protein